MTSTTPADRLAIAAHALDVAIGAGDILCEHLDEAVELVVEDKADPGQTMDLVTSADHAADAELRANLGNVVAAPYWSEEHGARPEADCYWLVDPLDGTNNFVNGLPLFGISVALMHRGAPVAAALHFPALGQSFHAAAGAGAFYRGYPLQLAPRPQSQWIVEVNAQPQDAEQLQALRALAAGVRAVRVLGSIALSLAWVAAGQLDLWVGRGYPWDVAGGMLLVAEAGGVNWSAADTPRDPLQRQTMASGARDTVAAALTQMPGSASS